MWEIDACYDMYTNAALTHTLCHTNHITFLQHSGGSVTCSKMCNIILGRVVYVCVSLQFGKIWSNELTENGSEK